MEKDIELVIKITEHDKNVIKRFVQGDGCEDFPPSIIEDLIRAVYFATQLPKGHGNIVDIEKLCEMFWDGNSMEITKDDLSVIEPIIEADKEREE